MGDLRSSLPVPAISAELICKDGNCKVSVTGLEFTRNGSVPGEEEIPAAQQQVSDFLIKVSAIRSFSQVQELFRQRRAVAFSNGLTLKTEGLRINRKA
jgi:hypothetical protein